MSVEIADFFVNVIEFKVFDDFLNLYLEDDVLKGSQQFVEVDFNVALVSFLFGLY